MTGAQDVPSESDFFQRRQAAAVLKHGIIGRYATVFTTMTGTSSLDHRVVYLDGYAGPGAYKDGTPGSPLLALATARAVARWQRQVDCVFVEADRGSYEQLSRRLREAAHGGASWRVLPGDVSDHLDETLALARGVPLLAFLDPFGSALSFDLLAGRLLSRPDRAPTEVLLNLNVDIVQRWGGLLRHDELNPGQRELLARLDRFFGGDWWRDVYLSARGGEAASTAAAAALAVLNEFRTRVYEQTGYGTFTIPVRRRPTQTPLFILVLFFRHPFAPWKFNEAASLANGEWRKAYRDEQREQEAERRGGQLSIDGFESINDNVDAEAERRLEQEWIAEISANLQRLAASQTPVDLLPKISEVYGRALGQARDKHVRRAWDTLAKNGVVRPRAPGVKVIYRDRISRP